MNSPVRLPLAVRSAVLVAALLLLTSLALAQPPDPRIVGGREAAPGEWPWMVALVQRGADAYDGQFCGGTLVGPEWVLTAAHCLQYLTAGDMNIIAGIHNLAAPEPDYQRVLVAEIILHPLWDPYYYTNDIALLRLATPIAERPGDGDTLPVRYAPLDGEEGADYVGRPATAIGWGSLRPLPAPGNTDFPPALQEVEVPVVSLDSCLSFAYGAISDDVLCAGLLRGGKGFCDGDDGGPLMIYDEGGASWQQVGIASYSQDCAAPYYPGVYTRVASYASWVREIITVRSNFAFIPVAINMPSPGLIANGDFEGGPNAGWHEYSSNGWPIVTSVDDLPLDLPPHSGSWAAWLGGDVNEESVLSQEITVSPAAPILSYFYWTASDDVCDFDYFSVIVGLQTPVLFTLCDERETNGWVRQSVSLEEFIGQTVPLSFIVTTDGSANSSVFLDDVQLVDSIRDPEPPPLAGPRPVSPSR